MRIRRNHDLGLDEAKHRLDKVADTLSSQFSLRSNWQGDSLAFRGTGVDGKVDVTDESIEFNVELGFALMLMEAPIKNAIEKALDDELG